MYNTDQSDIVLVTCTVAITAKSFAEISSYAAPVWTIKKPTEDALDPSLLVIVPEAIGAGNKGIAFVSGIHAVIKDGTPAVGDIVGSKKTAWTAKQGPRGFYVLKVDGNDLYVRMASTAKNYQWFKLTAGPSGSKYTARKQKVTAFGGFDAIVDVTNYNVQFINVSGELPSAEPGGAIHDHVVRAWSDGGSGADEIWHVDPEGPWGVVLVAKPAPEDMCGYVAP